MFAVLQPLHRDLFSLSSINMNAIFTMAKIQHSFILEMYSSTATTTTEEGEENGRCVFNSQGLRRLLIVFCLFRVFHSIEIGAHTCKLWYVVCVCFFQQTVLNDYFCFIVKIDFSNRSRFHRLTVTEIEREQLKPTERRLK